MEGNMRNTTYPSTSYGDTIAHRYKHLYAYKYGGAHSDSAAAKRQADAATRCGWNILFNATRDLQWYLYLREHR